MKTKTILLFTLVFLTAGAVFAPAATVFNSGSAWKYVLGTNEASSPISAWRALGFNDAAWLGGSTPIGYGEPEVVTTVPTGNVGGYTTIYLRKAFTIANPANVTQLELSLAVDDGVIVWINGIEVGRANALAGDNLFNALATAAPSQWFTNVIVLNSGSTPSLGSVLQGNNVLAVHLLNGTQGSSDIFIDGLLVAHEPDPLPPAITALSPMAGSTINELTQITVTFNEPVTGVDAADLRLNGTPSGSVSVVDNAYTFSFTQPAYGNVAITWAAGHGIADTAIPPNAFNPATPGHTWSYSLVDVAPPTVASLVPQVGATVISLTQIQVSFSEAVTGVNAADLTINGSSATNVMVVSPSQYVFEFPLPAAGAVSVAWVGGHGIRDLAAMPNNFGGGSWSYSLDPNAGAADLIITEFMFSNTRTLLDDDNEYSDWIEVHNPGILDVNLLGWFLTDDDENLTKWSFPATNLVAGGYMVVFASNKDKRTPGLALHTNFRLGSGDYVALVKPDGTNVTSAFPPVAQVADVSYGLSQNASETAVVSNTTPVRALVPTSDALGLTWTEPTFADGSWLAGVNGVGFEVAPGEPGQAPYGALIATDLAASMHNLNASAFVRLPFQIVDPTKVSSLSLGVRYDDGFLAYLNGAVVATRNAPVTATVADTVAEFSGTQGQDNWFYGYYNFTADGVPGYQTNDFIAFPRDAGPHSATSYWTGAIWDWFAGNPPWTELNATGGHPNGSNNGNVHWAIRRWRCEVNGTIKITLRYAKANAAGGNGTTGRIFRNGTQEFSQVVAGTDGIGINTTVTLNGVQIGDLIDLAIDPTGTDGTQADGSDGTTFTAIIEYQAPDLAYNSAATVTRSNSLGAVFENIDLSNAAQWLTAGDNILALHGLNAHATNADFLIQATLTARIPLPVTQGSARYFSVPTPGGPNGVGTANLGPIITDAGHTPNQPLDNQDLVVTARIAPAFSPVASNALVYRVMFGAEVVLPMFDDGGHGDGGAGDGVFGASIPASAATTNQMIRWFISATDAAGRSSRWPVFSDPTMRTPVYLGTVVADPALTNPLPVMHWFLQTPSGADSDAGTRCSVFYLGRFYDNIYANLHGQSSRGFPKKSYDLEFNPGYKFTYRTGSAPVGDVNFLTTYPDKAQMRNALAYEAFEALGSPYHWVEPVRVHQNGNFLGTWHLVENGDDEYVERLGLNPNNPLYKVYNTFLTSPNHATIGAGNVEKKSRKFEGSADLQALLTGILLTGEPRRTFVYDNVDLPQMLNSMAIRALIGEQDCCHKNYYLYRDTLGDREWEIWPWDVDLSYGRRWIAASTYWDDNMIIDTSMPVGANNGLLQALYNTPEIAEMYWRRTRTLMDEFLQAPGTPTNQLRLERRMDELSGLLAKDAAQDLTRWGTWCCGAAGPFSQANIPVPANFQTLTQAVNLMKSVYLPQRRTYLFTNRVVSAGGPIPTVQPTNARVILANFESNPVSGNQAEEYVVLTNINNFAVDISGWRIEGAMDFTFKPGTVIPAGRTLHVSPDLNAFRARATGPRAGQSAFVTGPYRGQLSARGETIRLKNGSGRLIDSWDYPGSASPAQQFLRVAEIMYHPSALAGNTNSPEEFEYIEVKNVGPSALAMAGVRFDMGIAFNFTGSAVTSLAAGQSAVIVRNAAAFTVRYGGGALVAGQYTGSLENGGERLRLVDTRGEEVLDFEYDNNWHPITDGLGFSLVIVDEAAEPDAWGRKSQWRPSGQLAGSPGQTDPAAPEIAPILITEVLNRTETPPPTDSIELHNPTTNEVNIGGWYLSDDFNSPFKYRIPDDTMLQPGEYRVFDESHFNPGGAGFALSSAGDEAYLFSASGVSNLTGYAHGTDFAAADNGVSFGRLVTTDGREHFVAQTARSLGLPNSGPRVGPVVIGEILYRPLDNVKQVGLKLPETEDNSADEFIELRNITAGAVPMFDPAAPANTWKITGGVDFAFPVSITLTAGEFVLIVNFNPADAARLAAFRAKFGVGPAVRVFGPYEGKLGNDSDDVELKKPVLLPGAVLEFVLIDKVDYRDEAPWPAGADGFGFSLQRWDAAGFGNEPANWVAATPTAAAATATNAAPPQFLTQPASQNVAGAAPVLLSASVTGAAPLLYQWMFNGAVLPGATNSSLPITSAGLEHAGDYVLFAYNPAGLAVSDTASLSVRVPPSLTQAPADRDVYVQPDPLAAPSTNVTFTVAAFSRSALTYQWRFNGTNVPGQTGTSFTIVNITTNHLGTVSVAVSDGVNSIQSTPVGLYPLVRPNFLVLPQPQSVPINSRVTLSTTFDGWPPPWTVEWRIGSVGQATNVQNEAVSFYSFTAPGVISTQQFRTIVRNRALPGGRATGFVPVVTLADADGDGIPDAWENAYGFNAGSNLDRDGDADGDGLSNWEEYVAGTNPTNDLSYLRINQPVPGNPVTVSFLASSNRTYIVQVRDSLSTGSWQRLIGWAARGSNHTATVTDPGAGSSRRFYQLVTPAAE